MTDIALYKISYYNMPKFEAVISKKAKRRQSATYGKCMSIRKSLKFDLNYKMFG